MVSGSPRDTGSPHFTRATLGQSALRNPHKLPTSPGFVLHRSQEHPVRAHLLLSYTLVFNWSRCPEAGASLIKQERPAGGMEGLSGLKYWSLSVIQDPTLWLYGPEKGSQSFHLLGHLENCLCSRRVAMTIRDVGGLGGWGPSLWLFLAFPGFSSSRGVTYMQIIYYSYVQKPTHS